MASKKRPPGPQEPRASEPSPDIAGAAGKSSDRVCVHFEATVLARLHALAGPGGSGRAGGVPHLIRQIVYEYLGIPLPTNLHGLSPPDVKRRASELAGQGLTLKQIADKLAEEGFKTPRGGTRWEPTQVRRLLQKPPGG